MGDRGPTSGPPAPHHHRSSEYGEHAEIAGAPQAVPPALEPDPAEHDNTVARDQRPAVIRRPEPKAIGRSQMAADVVQTTDLKCCIDMGQGGHL